MNKFYTFPLVLLLSSRAFAQTPCEAGFAGVYPCENVDLMYHMTLQQLGASENTNDIWGWQSPNSGKEYALVGCNNGTVFVDISNPTNPIKIGILPTHTVNSLWRDIETKGNYAYIVSEAEGHGMQVFDLLQLDNVGSPPQTFSESAHYAGFGNAHAITLTPGAPYAYCMGTNTFSGGLHIVNITDPLNPQIAGDFSQDGYTHDGFSLIYDGPDPDYIGNEIVFACNADAVTIVDATDKSNVQLISTNTYSQTGYTHQGWLTSDHRFFLFADELDEINFNVGTRTHIFDMTNLDNPSYVGYYQSTNMSIDHNLYIQDHFVFESNYRSGVRILDDIKVANGQLSAIGYFDLFELNDLPQFSGTWSNYPFLKSGNVIATSMYDGFFIIKPTLVTFSQNDFVVCGTNEAVFDVTVNADLQFPLSVGISGIPGSVIVSSPSITEPTTIQVTFSNLNSIPAGNYNGQLLLNTTFGEEYHFPITFEVAGGTPSTPVLMAPVNTFSIENNYTTIDFSWQAEPGASTYYFELASDNAFTSIIEQQTLASSAFSINYDLPNGIYFWRVRTSNSCGEGSWSAVSSFNIIDVSVTEIAVNNLSVYPNPSNSQLILSSDWMMNGSVEVYDLVGRKVSSQKVNGVKQLVLDVSEFPVGIYFIRNENEIVRFVKK